MRELIEIPDNPSLLQMQDIQFNVTKRMNTFIMMTTRETEQTGAAGFVFADQNAELQLPTLYNLIKDINTEKAKLANVT